MNTPTTIQLSNDEAIVLQQISEHGEDDIVSLSRGLRMNRHRVVQILSALRHKGLVAIKMTYGDMWVRVSARGRQLVRYMWPECSQMYQGV